MAQNTSPFLREDISDEQKASWRRKGGEVGGRRRRYVKGERIALEDISAVRAQLEEVIANARQMDQTPATINSLVNALRVYANIIMEVEEREQIFDEIEQIKAELGMDE